MIHVVSNAGLEDVEHLLREPAAQSVSAESAERDTERSGDGADHEKSALHGVIISRTVKRTCGATVVAMQSYKIAPSFVLTAVVLSVFAGALAWSVHAQDSAQTMTVYKSPTCGCCVKWIDHMRAAGYTMKVVDVEDIAEVKRTWGVPTSAAACHTSVAGSYVIEGHVPADVVARFLRERPAVAGIAVPGMPLGSPGMEQPTGRVEPYAIVTFDRAGRTTVYDRR
jgi:hypothetical protein